MYRYRNSKRAKKKLVVIKKNIDFKVLFMKLCYNK